VLLCRECASELPTRQIVSGVRLDLRGRKRCLVCLPHRPLRKPRRPAPRPVRMKTCRSCWQQFPATLIIEGKVRKLYRRRFCLTCSPFGSHNTSKYPFGIAVPESLREHRRRRRNAQTYRSLKKRRKRRKAELIEASGGRCESCGYDSIPAALEFHHRDPATKEFGLGNFDGARERLLREAKKCDLLCANCHRVRHTLIDGGGAGHDVVERRRGRKARAVAHMGGSCHACGRDGPPATFEFHHLAANEKDFGISETGILHRWEKVVSELAKCVMLCANCHREVHAGARELDEGLLGLAAEAIPHGASARRSHRRSRAARLRSGSALPRAAGVAVWSAQG